jgi:ubiquitin-protein ligase
VENILAQPNENNILEWHYVIVGPKDTVYEGGSIEKLKKSKKLKI